MNERQDSFGKTATEQSISDIDYNAIPEELTVLTQWVSWKLCDRSGKITKLPIDPHTGNLASTTNPATWGSFKEAQDAVARWSLSGIGFVFSANDPYCGVDLDACINDEGLDVWAADILGQIPSYTEISPSGRGLHIILRGSVPKCHNQKPIEIYDRARYFTMTGRHFPGTIGRIVASPNLEAVYAHYFGESDAPPHLNGARPRADASQLSDEAILEKCRTARNAAKFETLWRGDWGSYPSQSDADLALLGIIKFYSQETGQLDRLFRQSGLMRPKWDERRGEHTYGTRTILEALSHVAETYTFRESPNLSGMSGPATSVDGDQKSDLFGAVVSYKELLAMHLPARHQHVVWLWEGANVMVYGPRGVGKTFLQLALAVSLTTGQDFLGWRVSQPVSVLYIDGEMQLDELRQRATALMTIEPTASLEFLTSQVVYHKCNKDLVLTAESMRQEVVKILDARPDIRVLILDNISCLFAGINEDSKQDWEPINAWLIRLRHRGLATVLVHHSGKAGQQRGTSGREDSLDVVINLAKPVGHDARDGCHFELSFTKHRSVKGDDVRPLDVRLEEVRGLLRWTWKSMEVSKLDRARQLVAEGVTGPTELSEELGINKGYASRLLKKLKEEMK